MNSIRSMVFHQSRTSVALALLLLFIVSTAIAQAKNPRQVIVISIDGMTPDEYEHPDQHQLSIPNLRAMSSAGCASPGMLGVFPASIYPSHTSMITGVPPATHGIVSNTPIDPFNLEFGGSEPRQLPASASETTSPPPCSPRRQTRAPTAIIPLYARCIRRSSSTAPASSHANRYPPRRSSTSAPRPQLFSA